MKKKGFSLIEILVSLAIFMTVLMILLKFNTQSNLSKQYAEKVLEVNKISEILVTSMRREDYKSFENLGLKEFKLSKVNGKLELDNNFITKFPKTAKLISEMNITRVDLNKIKIGVNSKEEEVKFADNLIHKDVEKDTITKLAYKKKVAKSVLIVKLQSGKKQIQIKKPFLVFDKL